MNFQLIPIGHVMHIEITHGVLHIDFEDYDAFWLRYRGKKPVATEVYTASKERWRDYMLGFDFTWDDGTKERLSFKDFWHLMDHNWDWGSNSTHLRGRYSRDGTWEEPCDILDLKYSEILFQTHDNGACAFDRIYERVTGFTKDIEKMKDYVRNFENGLR